MERAELIAAVKKHALANYNREGWDYVVECWEDSDVDEAIGPAVEEGAAIANVRRIVMLMDERRTEVRNEIF